MYRLTIQSEETGKELNWTITEEDADQLIGHLEEKYGEPVHTQLESITRFEKDGSSYTFQYPVEQIEKNEDVEED